MEILSKNILIQEALKNQNAWLIKFELEKNVNYSNHRYNEQIVPEFRKIFPEEVISEAEIRVLYYEDFIIKKFNKYSEMIEVWKIVPKITKSIENEVIKDYFIIYCSAIDKDGMEIKNNK